MRAGHGVVSVPMYELWRYLVQLSVGYRTRRRALPRLP
ncbi:hypothetical protein I541_2769 [Mycobacteroides abscessus]|uniref:Uncharacterized protein n=1 Tax=Mycobacteroides abscessus 21 TaxID=1299324 RepID=A0A829Q7H1_9MYCO|nr:hypothetical protein MA4S0726RA_0439 [Mycobacteroides abscessus 4S-0726-RA]EIU03366.1 hypothetical protein MA4S0303_0714 [Mycobacteroides abscessus 4S-0303]EIU99294.1 hypothetical protein MA6G0212_0578 [Mycobacteroides abscessus 6G-0212]EIV61560.1 hypothetical protein MA4S0116S_4474 [Mycobacteroides abscessus 4S-0116-S]EUA48228.1 hypothetical protein I543_0654 [Mycobacteroides abscessus 21]EUA78291.1 hypothetical protein I541_2769 [Mycobacteroides abscessus]